MVAERLYDAFRDAPGPKRKPVPRPATADLSGHWEIDIEFVASATRLKLYLSARASELAGSYSSPLVPHGTVKGTVSGNEVEIRTHGRFEATNFDYIFRGTAAGDEMSGTVELGWEYGQAPWKARRVG